MKRLPLLVVVVVVLAGCRWESPPMVNPFVGPTKVPPPGTSIYPNDPPNSYYPGSPGLAPPYGTTPQAPANGAQMVAPGGVQTYAPNGTQNYAPSGVQNYSPPGGTFNYGGSSAPGSGVPTPSRSAMREPSASQTETLMGRPRVVRTLQPRPKDEVAGIAHVEIPRSALVSTSDRPRLLNVPEDAIDIADLPKASASRSDATGFRLVSGSDDSNGPAKVTTASGSASHEGDDVTAAEFAQPTFYGHAADYGWLRGKVEYSQIDRKWKLRYIPVEGQTDDFGGSVVISDAAALAGFERGDFVELRGRVGQRAQKSGFAPTYEVTQAERLGKAAP